MRIDVHPPLVEMTIQDESDVLKEFQITMRGSG
jgi:hypothetical protein